MLIRWRRNREFKANASFCSFGLLENQCCRKLGIYDWICKSPLQEPRCLLSSVYFWLIDTRLKVTYQKFHYTKILRLKPAFHEFPVGVHSSLADVEQCTQTGQLSHTVPLIGVDRLKADATMSGVLMNVFKH